MTNTIFGNYIYLTLFYFFAMLPCVTLLMLPGFRFFQKKTLEVKTSFIKSYFYFYTVFCALSIFAASLAFFLLMTNKGSMYFLVHFGLIVPLSGYLLGSLFSKIIEKKPKKNFSTITVILLSSFSFFISFIYMGLKAHLGLGL